jgi:RNAse (barnase) inhibitor barstar
MAKFIFSENFGSELFNSGFKCEIPMGIADVDQLMESMADKMNFPSYFGSNWNALFDCLADLGWIDEKFVFIIHRDIPKLDMDQILIYIKVLKDAVDDWKEGDDHLLFVIFPDICESEISKLLELI